MSKPIYKFVRGVDAAISIAAGRLKFSPVAELNDPNELIPYFERESYQASLATLRATGYSEEQFCWLQRQGLLLSRLLNYPRRTMTVEMANQQIRSTRYDDLESMDSFLQTIVSGIRRNCGILSLTYRYDSFPMWSHYADYAKGFVVVFKDLAEVFAGDETRIINELVDVEYLSDFT